MEDNEADNTARYRHDLHRGTANLPKRQPTDKKDGHHHGNRDVDVPRTHLASLPQQQIPKQTTHSEGSAHITVPEGGALDLFA
jgi:hypothetical protein